LEKSLGVEVPCSLGDENESFASDMPTQNTIATSTIAKNNKLDSDAGGMSSPNCRKALTKEARERRFSGAAPGAMTGLPIICERAGNHATRDGTRADAPINAADNDALVERAPAAPAVLTLSSITIAGLLSDFAASA
jgi:hypothetical protein